MKKRKILFVHRGRATGDKALPNFAPQLDAAGYDIDTFAVEEGAKAKGLPAIWAGLKNLSDYDAIVASEYYLVWALAIRLILTRVKTPLIALGFNQSSRLVQTGVKPVDALLNRIWKKVTLFVVHSIDEAGLFAFMHDIAPSKFAFSHWGYDLPHFDRGAYEARFPAFVSMIGRNNRDVSLFCKAVSMAGTNGVLVTSHYMMTRELLEAVPDTIQVLLDVPMSLCLDIVSQSTAHLILVSDDKRGAGHISAVSAMLLRKPQIYSDVNPLSDYLIDNYNGIAVPMNDADATANAIARIMSDPSLAKKIGENGFDLATHWMSNDRAASRSAELILGVIERDTHAMETEDWRSAREAKAAD